LTVEINTGITTGIKIKIETEREVVISSKIIFFFFGHYNISVDITKNSTIIISSASEISALEIDSIYYQFPFIAFGCA